MGGRLEGWMHGGDSRPSFETRRKDAALLRMRSEMFHALLRARSDIVFTGLSAELGQYLDDLLIAVHDLAQEAFPVNVAVLVERRFHQDAGLVLRRDRHAVQGLGEQLAVELAHFLGDVRDEVDGGVALDAVVIAHIVEALLEALGELLHRRDRRLDREADVAAHALGGALGEIDDLLTKQGGLADQRGLDALLLGLAEESRALFLVDIDKIASALAALILTT